jgi:hypothetical protein
MRSTRGKLIEFAIGVAGGTLLIAGLLSIGSDSNVPRVWVAVGIILVVLGQFIHWRAKR